MIFLKLYIYLFVPTQAMVINTLRNKVLHKQQGTCGLCFEKFNLSVPHEIHHLNHNHSDNNINNLVALCSNCHQGHHRFGIPVYPYFPNSSVFKKPLNMPNFYEEFY